MAFRDGPFENIKVPAAWTAGVAVAGALVFAVFLLAGGAREGSNDYAAVRGGSDAVTGPVSGVLAAPFRWLGGIGDGIGGYFFAVSENRRLKARIAELEGWRDDAIALKGMNARYETMLGIRPEPPVPMAGARTIADVRGPYSRARLLDSGASKGIRIGNPVLNEHGLVGRISGTTAGYSRLVLLTDVASRTPVLIERTDARAILTGDGSGNPRLAFVRGQDAVQAGDRILSSGDGGGIPRGLPIGVAAKGLDGAWRVKLYSDRGSVDIVRVMLFQDFGQLVDPNALNAEPLASLAAAPEPTPAQAAAIADAAARRAAADLAQAERLRAAAQAAATAPPPAAPQPASPSTPAASPPSTPAGAPPQ